jgi:hypothetical protein
VLVDDVGGGGEGQRACKNSPRRQPDPLCFVQQTDPGEMVVNDAGGDARSLR